jgi:2-amino-4-hydroxy-6-hydroxymethyldihydropteridine diphosphokinase
MSIVYILLGSNLGNKLSNLNQAVVNISATGVNVIQLSPIYQTKAWGNINQDDFFNVVLKAETKHNALTLIEKFLAIELHMGRERDQQKWMPRLIDIDILYFNDEIIQLPNLVIPHPFIPQRRFTLMPLNDIAPDYIHPELKISNNKLLKKCSDSSQVLKTKLNLNVLTHPL